MPTSNPWLTPYQRSYNDIKDKIISNLRLKVPEINDFSEGNIFILIISIFAAIAEVIHYYIDNMAREAFLPTARRFSSVYKHAKLVDYHIKAGVPATVDITIYRSSGKPIDSDITIPVNTVFTSADGKQWLSTKTIVWGANGENPYSVKVPLVQKTKVGDPDRISFGQITSKDVIIYLGDLPTNQKYVEGSMTLFINNEAWTLVDTFAYANSRDKVYKVEIDQNLKPFIMFGDGQFGMKPDLNGTVEGIYYLTYGSSGNIDQNQFNTVPNLLTDIESDIVITNLLPATGGTDYEDFYMIKDHIPLSIKTLGVAITKEDFEAVAKLVPGVDKAYVDYICGKYVQIYITPDGGGEASSALIESVRDRISKSKVITTSISVMSTHRSVIYLYADITGRKSFNKSDISDQVSKALLEAYSYNTSDINKVVRLSDIYALIDNQNMVDYLTVNKLFLMSYPQPSKISSPELNITYLSQDSFNKESEDGSISYEQITVTITKSGYNLKGASGGSVNGTYGKNIKFSNDAVSFDITINQNIGGLVYNVDDTYTFNLGPMNRDLTPTEFNIPVFITNSIQLTIHEVV